MARACWTPSSNPSQLPTGSRASAPSKGWKGMDSKFPQAWDPPTVWESAFSLQGTEKKLPLLP
jgi:hypothetical protein